MTSPVAPGMAVTVATVGGLLVILSTMVLTGTYVLLATASHRPLKDARPMHRSLLPGLALAAAATPALAAESGGGMNPVGWTMFVAIVLTTLGITWWAARRAHSADQFYAAGGQITGFQNGIALAGDMISAGALLGLAGLICASGFDGLIFAVGYATGPALRGVPGGGAAAQARRYTVADVLSTRLSENPIRIFTAVATLVIVMF